MGAPSGWPSGLPVPATPLVGRERDLALARALIVERHARLVTLTGHGGVGKTRLAIQLASDLQAAFTGGVAIIDLAPIADPELVVPAVCRALGMPDGGLESLRDRLGRTDATDPCLIILDNFEHVIAAAPHVSELLAGAPRLTLIVTSRSVLNLSGEHAFDVPPLALPSEDTISLGHLKDVPAVRLFAERAFAAARDFSFTAETAPAVVSICRKLEGLPLAIELAATRLRVLGLPDLLARLEHPLDVLTAGARDLPARQHTLRSNIAWSVDLLEPEAATTFRRAAAFRGGWTLDAASALADATDGDCLEAMAALLDLSLVRRTSQTSAGPRFSMLEAVREYALEELMRAGEAEAIQRRHLAFYLSLAQRAAQALDGPQQAIWLARLDEEHENFRTALSFAIAHAGSEAVRLAAALGRFWEVRGYLLEGRRWLNAALAAAPGADPADRASALRAAGTLARTSGDLEAARSLMLASIDLQERAAMATGDADDQVATAELARTWFELAQVAHYVGDFGENASACERSLTLYERVVDRRGVAAAKGMLGHAAWHLHDLTRALDLITESIAVWEELGDSLSVSWAHWDLGNISRDRAELEKSRRNFEVALLGGRRAGDAELLAVALDGLAFLEFLDGRAHVAAELLGAAEEVRRSHAIVRALPYDRDVYAPILAAIRDELPAGEFDYSWAAGAARALQDTIGLVLASGEGPHEGAGVQDEPQQPPAAAGPNPPGRLLAGLTPREGDVLRLLAQGYTNQEIADSLVISLNTVYRHVSSILAKTGTANRTEAALFAIRNGADLGAAGHGPAV